MTAKEKAKSIVVSFKNMLPRSDYHVLEVTAKECALIAVEELIEVAWWTATGELEEPYRTSQKEFWQEVKKEIEQL